MTKQYQNNYQNNEENENFIKLMNMLNENTKHINFEKEAILVIGDTGAGKSTLINYLILGSDKLMTIKAKNSLQSTIEVKPGYKVSDIGHSTASKTLVPTKIQDFNSPLVYWDCPGFEDTKGPLHDIINLFYLYKLIKNSKKIKLLVVVEESAINGSGRAKAFKELIIKLANLFGEEEGFIDSLVLVITKVRFIDNFKKELKDIINDDNSFTSAQLNFFNKLISKYNIAIFEAPVENYISEINRVEILSVLNNIPYYLNPQINLALSNKSKLLLEKFIMWTDNQATLHSNELIKYIINSLDKLQIKELKTIKTTLKDFIKKTETTNISVLIDYLYYEIIDKICANSIENSRSLIEKNISQIKFLISCNDFFRNTLEGLDNNFTTLKSLFIYGIRYPIKQILSQKYYQNIQEKFEFIIHQNKLIESSFKNKLKELENNFEIKLDNYNKKIANLKSQLITQQKENLYLFNLHLILINNLQKELNETKKVINQAELKFNFWNNGEEIVHITLPETQEYLIEGKIIIKKLSILAHNFLKFNFNNQRYEIKIIDMTVRSPGIEYKGGAKIDNLLILTESNIVILTDFAANNVVIEQIHNEDDEKVRELLKAVNLIPGCGEYVLDPVHSTKKSSKNCLNEMKVALPNIQWIAPVIAWFANSLNIANCKISPGIDVNYLHPENVIWKVANYDINNAYKISSQFCNILKKNIINYGGSINDQSVIDFLILAKSKNLKILFYPLIMIDIEGKPWRGRISGEAEKVKEFYYQQYEPFILHYANLVKDKVDGFIIGSELVGLTRIHDQSYNFPFIQKLIELAAKVKDIVGNQIKVTYAADWSEYFSSDGNLRPLDSLWASNNIDVVGIDAYFPLTNMITSSATLEEIKEGWKSNIGWDYWFDSNNEKKSFSVANAWKNLEYWWENEHWEYYPETKKSVKTLWIPKMKPIWFTEFGFPSIDKAPNKPNVFYDPNSSESSIPTNSNHQIDFAIQRKSLRASLEYWQNSKFVEKMFCWCWDTRGINWHKKLNIYADGDNWKYGHWIDGKIGNNNTLIITNFKQNNLTIKAFNLIILLPYLEVTNKLTLYSEKDIRILVKPNNFNNASIEDNSITIPLKVGYINIFARGKYKIYSNIDIDDLLGQSMFNELDNNYL